MSLNKRSKAIGFGRLFAALASPLAVRTLVAVSTLGIACMSGSAQSLTLDDFTTGQYVVTINNVNTKDLHYAPLPPGSPLGGDQGGGGDRRGRRSRRGRGQRSGGGSGGGRGLPDAKYYSPRPDAESRHQASPAAGIPEAAPVGEPAALPRVVFDPEQDDFFVLPGESLAKYRSEEH